MNNNVIKIDFKIPIYSKTAIGLDLLDYSIFELTFNSLSPNQKNVWVIYVNGVKTDNKFDINQKHQLHKDKYLKAISDYVNGKCNKKVIHNKFITHDDLKAYSNLAKYCVNNRLLIMTKEMNRDRLGEHNLNLFDKYFGDGETII